MKKFLVKAQNSIMFSFFESYRKPQGAALMFPFLLAFLGHSGYCRLEAYREFIKSHTDREQCDFRAVLFRNTQPK